MKQGTECFVYWKDPKTRKFWGLNFINAADARRFKDWCTVRRGQCFHIAFLSFRTTLISDNIRYPITRLYNILGAFCRLFNKRILDWMGHV